MKRRDFFSSLVGGFALPIFSKLPKLQKPSLPRVLRRRRPYLFELLTEIRPMVPSFAKLDWTGQEPDFMDIAGHLAFPVYGGSGGVTTSQTVYVVACMKGEKACWSAPFEIVGAGMPSKRELIDIVKTAVVDLESAYSRPMLMANICGGDLGRSGNGRMFNPAGGDMGRPELNRIYKF